MCEVLTVTCNPAIDQTVEVTVLRPGEVNRGQKVRMDPGGKGINVARVLKGWQTDVMATGWIGTANGDFVVNALDRMGILHQFVPVDAVTRINCKIAETKPQRMTELNAPGFRVDAKDVDAFIHLFDRLLDQAKVVVLSGSLPTGAPNGLYRDCIEMAKRKNVKAFLDAEGVPFKLGVDAVPFAVKPNRRELGGYVGTPLDTEQNVLEAGRRLLEIGIRWVAVSDGANGAWLMTETKTIRTIPPRIEAKSPVGSGDSMMAALVWGWLQGKSEEEVARFATAAGTVTAAHAGTELCGWEETVAMSRQIHLERISSFSG
ncbi:tagatose-6-phosphate kinase [Polycladomyces abyssicola]|uniref:Tagatose-6-phosphate kinase n=1 Tax=Polycladomyces abyssicola TaxID=1125966 RepID=A0A8D5UBZ2_9BACL|nr:1-phosphofructokinase [Polycladomyces abyssicola]BCU80666.1 tagatose-6-phosphate kinase [Polycladomyces abyssicola]